MTAHETSGTTVARRSNSATLTEYPAAGPRPAAVTLDFWDTLYLGEPYDQRLGLQRRALRELLDRVGYRDLSDEEVERARRAASAEVHRWWSEEHRGFGPSDVLRLTLDYLDVRRPDDCEHVARAIALGEQALDRFPPALLPGAAELVHALADAGVRLAVISDTGYTTGVAQNRVLKKDGLLDVFAATIYSDECGHAKPHPKPFGLALERLGLPASEVLHVGDLEQTDVKGALAAGMRAVRLDAVTDRGPSKAERVVKSHDALRAYLLNVLSPAGSSAP